jgi:hypothetical protein
MEFWRYRRKREIDPMTSSNATLVTPTVVHTLRDPEGPPDRIDAFKEGLRRGRQEERLRHRGHPFITLAVLVVAAAGAAVIAMAAHEGSFSKGGAIVDQNLAVAADNAKVQAADAAAKASQAVKDAGEDVQQKVSAAVAPKT